MSKASAFVRTVRGLRIALLGVPAKRPAHQHQWETIAESNVAIDRGGRMAVIALQYTLRCKQCGEITTRRSEAP
jgi:hypothetical protein